MHWNLCKTGVFKGTYPYLRSLTSSTMPCIFSLKSWIGKGQSYTAAELDSRWPMWGWHQITGTFRVHVQPLERVSTRVWTGSPPILPTRHKGRDPHPHPPPALSLIVKAYKSSRRLSLCINTVLPFASCRFCKKKRCSNCSVLPLSPSPYTCYLLVPCQSPCCWKLKQFEKYCYHHRLHGALAKCLFVTCC